MSNDLWGDLKAAAILEGGGAATYNQSQDFSPNAARKLTVFIEQATFRFRRQNYKSLLADAARSLNDCFRVDTDQSTDAVNQLG
jgi:hypothetical protein